MSEFAGVLIAIFWSLVLLSLVMIGVSYVYCALTLMFIAWKTKTPNAWLAWIPIGNLYLGTQIGGVPWWTMFAFVFIIFGMVKYAGPLKYAGLLFLLAFVAVYVWWWWKIAQARRRPGWWGVLMAIPIVNCILRGILAWGE